jgi:hypothetical protein
LLLGFTPIFPSIFREISLENSPFCAAGMTMLEGIPHQCFAIHLAANVNFPYHAQQF